MSNKKYGLILSDKGIQKPTFQASRNVFGNDSDSEDASSKKPVLLRPSDNTTRQASPSPFATGKMMWTSKAAYKFLGRGLSRDHHDQSACTVDDETLRVSESERTTVLAHWSQRSRLMDASDNMYTASKAKITQEKALTEDPTVYQYDEIYEEMAMKKDKVKVKTKEEKKPQYIEKLIKAASKRKIENERRIERQVQKEREKEGEEFQDKEVFVTSAYKKKLEEMRLEEEKEKREEYLENIGDVTKQNDLGGFYRHLYEQKLGKDKQEVEEIEPPNKMSGNDEKDDSSQKTKPHSVDTQKKRNYRKRKSSDGTRLSEGEIEDSDEEINRVNLDDIRMAKKYKQENIDADSDFSIDESSDEEQDKKHEETKQVENESKDKETGSRRHSSEKRDKKLKTEEKQESKEIKDDVKQPKEKVDIWKKRTVGPVFEEALKRYYERKAARGC